MIAAPFRAALQSASRFVKGVQLNELRDDPATKQGRPTIVGLFRAASGIGSGARLLYLAMAEAGLNPATIDLTDQLAPNQASIDWAPPTGPSEDDGSGPVVFHLNSPEIPYALNLVGPSWLKGRMRIAYWAWELERMPGAWRGNIRYFHEIWAPSEFTVRAIEAAKPGIPVRSVGYALPLSPPDLPEQGDWLDMFAPNGERIILNAFDMRSSMDRKNPIAAINVFRDACRDRDDAILLLKPSSSEWCGADSRRLMDAINGDHRIRLVTRTLNASEMRSLIASSDIYLSPHRSEGFGLMLVKSLLAGMDVIMTNWSGNVDFGDLPGVHPIDYDLIPVHDQSKVYNAPGSVWADPDAAQAAQILRDLLAMPVEERDQRRHAIAGAASERFSVSNWTDKLGTRFYEGLSEHQQERVP
jgi:glycosyltransferase involved in cell wall biosynthesis